MEEMKINSSITANEKNESAVTETRNVGMERNRLEAYTKKVSEMFANKVKED